MSDARVREATRANGDVIGEIAERERERVLERERKREREKDEGQNVCVCALRKWLK